MNDEKELDKAKIEFIENLIFDCAVDSGFFSDGNNYFAGHSGEVDVTEELFNFTVLMVEKMNLLLSPNTKAQ